MRIGQGFDVHALVAGRALIIGGVTIAFEKVTVNENVPATQFAVPGLGRR